MNAIFQLVNPSNTITVNRPLAHALGLNEAIIYGALISKFYYYSERGMLNDGWFYSTAPDLAESTALSERQQKRAVDNLIGAGLIRSELRGMPAKRSFYIVEDVDVLQSLIAVGEAKMREIKPAAAERYEKKRQPSEDPQPETRNLINFLSESFRETMPERKAQSAEVVRESKENSPQNAREAALLHCSDKSAEQAPTKCRSKDRQNVGASSAQTSEQHNLKKSNINNLDIINPSITRAHAYNSSGSDKNDMIDLQAERENYFSVLKENIDYDYLCEAHKYDKSQIDEMLGIMLDVVCSSNPTIRANGGDIPQEVVKSVFLKLDSDHIDYVLDSLKKNTSDVRNIRAYLITTLYNAPNTIDSYYRARVNHDMEERKQRLSDVCSSQFALYGSEVMQ